MTVGPNWDDDRNFLKAAWFVYWKMVRKAKRELKCSLLAAHRHVQSQHPFKIPRGVRLDHHWKSDDFLALFMLQFEDWQVKDYDLDNLYPREVDHAATMNRIKPDMPLEKVFAIFSDERRDELVGDLWCRGHKKLLEQLFDDPIFGAEAKWEADNIQNREAWRVSEDARRAALHPNVQKIDSVLKDIVNASNYNVNYPWPPNHLHNIPNCLLVTADGGMIFRLEVLDPDTCTRFRLATLAPPWWKEYGLLEPCEPGEGEYDFPFYDFDIKEDDVIDFAKLMEVLNRGKEQIVTRRQRKWGIRNQGET
jgi:hypothetical protein